MIKQNSAKVEGYDKNDLFETEKAQLCYIYISEEE